MNNIRIIKYTFDYENIWEEFVKNAVFGTIYHTRKFINYHPANRFDDNSILIYNNEELVCVVPVCCKHQDIINYELIHYEDGDIDIDPNEFSTTCNIKKYFSYMGATFGGPVFSKKYFETKYIKILLNVIYNYYQQKIEFRIPNEIYFNESIISLYYLLSQKSSMIPELSWYININSNIIDNIKNKRNKSHLNKMINNKNISCYKVTNHDEYKNFHDILVENLSTRHKTYPTHTYEELIDLQQRLNDKQSLYIAKEDNIILGGILVVKVTNKTWYTLYLTRNLSLVNEKTYLPAVISYISIFICNDAKLENVDYLDYGICTENSGTELNDGLCEYKEKSLGCISSARYLFFKK